MADPKDFSQLIPPHGGYRKLQSYKMSQIVYDGTVGFLLGRLVQRLEQQFLKDGGFAERLYRTRSQMRNWGKNT